MANTAVLHSFSRRASAPSGGATAAVEQARSLTSCQTCGMRDLCLPAGLSTADRDQLNRIVVHRKRTLRRGEYLFRAGGAMQSLFALQTGFLKTCVLHDDGREQVAGFHMMGDLLGLDAIGSGTHICDAVALEDTEICEIPFHALETLSQKMPSLQQHFHRLMSREITRDHGVMLLLGSMRAEERLAAFLLNLSQRFAARGYSSTSFVLRMTREEIGSYLGLKLETVSRALSHFQSEGWITVQNKNIELRSPQNLRAVLGLRAPQAQ